MQELHNAARLHRAEPVLQCLSVVGLPEPLLLLSDMWTLTPPSTAVPHWSGTVEVPNFRRSIYIILMLEGFRSAPDPLWNLL